NPRRHVEAQHSGKVAPPRRYSVRPLHPHPHVRFWGSPITRHLRGGFLSSPASGVLWLAGGSQTAAPAFLKEAVHELGHTLNLSHCEDYQCAMAPSHGVEWMDLKSSRFCGSCRILVPARSTVNASP